MAIKFKKPTTAAGWSEHLEEIITAGRVALQENNRADLSAANTALNLYIKALGDSDDWTHDLDHAAREALGYLTVDLTSATVEDLASRTDQLRQLANAINDTAKTNEQAAANIRHEKLTNAMLSAMDAAKSANELIAAVKDQAGDKSVVDAAETLLESIAGFKDALSKADTGN